MMQLETLTIENQQKIKKSVYPLYAIMVLTLLSTVVLLPIVMTYTRLQLLSPVIVSWVCLFFLGEGLFVHLTNKRKEHIQKDLQENTKEVYTGSIRKTKRTQDNNQQYFFTIDGVDFFVPAHVYNKAVDGDQYRIEKAKYTQGVIFAIEKITV
jgi:hypothetical protein